MLSQVSTNLDILTMRPVVGLLRVVSLRLHNVLYHNLLPILECCHDFRFCCKSFEPLLGGLPSLLVNLKLVQLDIHYI